MKKYNSIITLLMVLILIFVNYFFRIDKVILIALFSISLIIFIFSKTKYLYFFLGILIGIVILYRYSIISQGIDYSQDNKFFYVHGVVTKVVPKEEYTLVHVNNTILDKKIKGPNIFCYSFGDVQPKIGDIVFFKNKIFIPKNKKIPGGFNYYNFLLSKNLTSYAYVDTLTVVGRDKSLVLNFQRNFDEFIKIKTKNFEENLSRFLYSSFTGRNTMFETVKEDYKNLGISHILAISGFHIMIIYSILINLFEFLRMSMSYRKIVSLLIVGFYCLLIDFPYSSFRAFLFLCISVLSYLLNRPEDGKKTIAISALIILIIFPNAVFDLGFQFSFFAIMGMEILYPIIKNKKEKDTTLVNGFYLILSVNLAILPLQAYYFKNISPFVFFGNLIVIPILTIVLYSFIGYLVLGSFPLIGRLIGFIIKTLYKISEYIIVGLTPSGGFKNIEITFKLGEMLVYLSLVGILLIIIYHRHSIRRILVDYSKSITIYFAVALMLLLFITNYNPIGRIIMIDIGQGDCFLIQYKDKSFLIDTGGKLGEKNNSNVVLDNLSYNKIKQIDGIFLSHLDKDHIGNLKYILNKFPNTKVYSHEKSLETLSREYVNSPINLEELHKDDKLIYDSIFIEILNYDYTKEENDNSLVMKVKIGDSTILFTGDISGELERVLLAEDIKSDILKLSHHGSKNSSTEEFISKVNPFLALVSVGEYNSYNHPDINIMESLKSKGIGILRTDISGNGYIDFYKNSFIAYNSTNYVKNKIFSPFGKRLMELYGLSILYFWLVFKRGGVKD